MRDVVTAEVDESVVAAARRMAEHNVGDLIVVSEQAFGLPRPIGIVTDRDLVVQVLARPDRDSDELMVGDVMQAELVVAFDDDDVEYVVSKMREHAIRRVPIIDHEGGLQGLLSIDDVFGWMRDQIQIATRLLERQGEMPQRARR